MTNAPSSTAYASGGVFWMIVTALLFGYFGFVIQWREAINDEPIWIVSVFKWTLQGTCIGAAISTMCYFLHRRLAGIIFSLVGIGSAVMFAAVLVWHYATDAPAPIHPLLIALIMLVNGYGGYVELRELIARPARMIN